MKNLTVRNVLDHLAAKTLLCLLTGDEEGAIRAATAGENMSKTVEKLRVPLDAPYALLHVVAEAAGIIKTTPTVDKEAA